VLGLFSNGLLLLLLLAVGNKSDAVIFVDIKILCDIDMQVKYKICSCPSANCIKHTDIMHRNHHSTAKSRSQARNRRRALAKKMKAMEDIKEPEKVSWRKQHEDFCEQIADINAKKAALFDQEDKLVNLHHNVIGHIIMEEKLLSKTEWYLDRSCGRLALIAERSSDLDCILKLIPNHLEYSYGFYTDEAQEIEFECIDGSISLRFKNPGLITKFAKEYGLIVDYEPALSHLKTIEAEMAMLKEQIDEMKELDK
jgi:hypothetical protein